MSGHEAWLQHEASNWTYSAKGKSGADSRSVCRAGGRSFEALPHQTAGKRQDVAILIPLALLGGVFQSDNAGHCAASCADSAAVRDPKCDKLHRRGKCSVKLLEMILEANVQIRLGLWAKRLPSKATCFMACPRTSKYYSSRFKVICACLEISLPKAESLWPLKQYRTSFHINVLAPFLICKRSHCQHVRGRK